MGVSVYPDRLVGGQLAQDHPLATNARTFVDPPADTFYVVTALYIDNSQNSAGDADISVFHDDDGSTYDTATALLYEHKLEKGQFIQLFDSEVIVRSPGTLGIQVSTADTATFTAYGYVG